MVTSDSGTSIDRSTRFLCRGSSDIVEDGSLAQAVATLEELDWCLEQLETMQTHKSVSDLASLKVRQPFDSQMKLHLILFLV